MEDRPLRAKVISAYANGLVKAYCACRFLIINDRILGEIGQYLPRDGRILDVGCGFGLFSLYYACRSPQLRFVSIDINEQRISMARAAAVRLGVGSRIEFEAKKAQEFKGESGAFRCVYMLDLLHHMTREDASRLLGRVYDVLVDGGVAIIKDVETRPAWKMWFTWILDMVMTPGCPPCYFDRKDLADRLLALGFDVKVHVMLDILPYPHVLYVCRKMSS